MTARRLRRALVTALAVVLASLLATPHPAGAVGRPDRHPVAADSVRVFGLSAPGPDHGLASASATSKALGRGLEVLNFFEAWGFGNPFPVDALRTIAAAGARPEITWEPWDPAAGADQPTYSPARIAGGAFDAYVTGWAHGAAAYGAPLFLRFAHEMNLGTSYPWAPAVNGGGAAAYVAAWRHVHDLFAAAGATNVLWVWSPGAIDYQPTPLPAVYPGDAYVDITAIDGYNYGADMPQWGGWLMPRRIFGSTIAAISRIAPGKPLWINETGTTEHGGDKGTWVTALFEYLRNTPVSGVIWFDYAVPGSPDFRLASSPSSLAAAADSLRDW